MLTVLDLLNRFLGYFNIQDKAKGKAFTVVAFVANFYVLYLAINHLRFAGYRVQGALFLVAFLVILYFVVLNFVYYFTTKTVWFDISPTVAKWLGGDPQAMKAAENALAAGAPKAAANGVFDDDHVLPAVITVSPSQQRNLDELVDTMVQAGRMRLDYAGLDDKAIERVAQKTQAPVPAMGAPIELPYFTLAKRHDDLYVMGGLNALQPVELAAIERVGLMPVTAAQADYDLAAAHVYVTGGTAKHLGRQGLITQSTPFSLTVALGYTPKSQPAER